MNKEIEEYKKFQKRIFILGIGKGLFSIFLIAKLYYLQILNKSKFGKLSEDNRIKIKILYPERGIIFDHNNKKIAENRIDYQLSFLKEKKKLIDDEILNLKKIINISSNDIAKLKKNLRISSFDDFITIKKNLTWAELEVFEYFSHKFPFFTITKEKVRSYENNYAFSHIVGYVGYTSQKKINQKSPDLKIGKTGIEKVYNSLLLGKEGWQKIESNSSGITVRKLESLKSMRGENLNTHLDLDIQENNFNLLKNMSGSLVLMDIKNGGIISMISSPSFDINEFSYGIRGDRWKKLQKDPNKPLLNKSISGLYSPGSTFKLLVALLAMKNKNFNINQKLFCSGSMNLGNHKFHCWKRKGHGFVNLHTAIKESCDCYFYSLANDIQIDDLASLAKIFSIGRKTNIDLPNELDGLMPTEKWKRKNKNDSWHLGETYNAVIGQGFTLSTPLQIATMTARLASGKLVFPKIKKDFENRVFEDLDIDDASLNFIRQSMFSVVNEYKGTAFASKLKNKKYKMAGKTGTSQVRRISIAERESGVLDNEELPYKLRDHSIFTGYAPFDNPRFSIAVILEHAGSGSKVAAPMARDIIDYSLKKMKI